MKLPLNLVLPYILFLPRFLRELNLEVSRLAQERRSNVAQKLLLRDMRLLARHW